MINFSKYLPLLSTGFPQKIACTTFCIVFFTFLICPSPTLAKDIPYYASIKSDEANIRSGPSSRYPILWTYKRKNWPVKVTATFERWRKISDTQGEIGWIHEVLLSNKRYVTIKAQGMQEVYRLPIPTSTKVFMVEDGVIAEIKECKNNWCKIKADHHEGWLKQENLWGVENGEVIE